MEVFTEKIHRDCIHPAVLSNSFPYINSPYKDLFSWGNKPDLRGGKTPIVQAAVLQESTCEGLSFSIFCMSNWYYLYLDTVQAKEYYEKIEVWEFLGDGCYKEGGNFVVVMRSKVN